MTAYRLLKYHVVRNLWVYALFGLLQYIASGTYWAYSYERIPLEGALLGMVGTGGVLNIRSQVWRSLPLTQRDAAIFRWWASAGIPGIFLTLVILLACMSQLTSRLPAPHMGIVLQGLLGTWAALGVIVALPPGWPWMGGRWRVKKILASLVSCAALLVYAALLAYGLPIGPATLPYTIAFVCIGLSLLLYSALQAYRGTVLPDARSTAGAGSTAGAAPSGAMAAATAYPGSELSAVRQRVRAAFAIRCYGAYAILLPLLQRTMVFALVAASAAVLLHLIFPTATKQLIASYFTIIPICGNLLTRRYRAAVQVLRCLPLSTRQLAALLQILGALPGIASVGLMLFVNRVFLHLGIDVVTVLLAVLAIFCAQTVLEQAQVNREDLAAQRGALPLPLLHWVTVLQGTVLWPFWFSMLGVFCASSFPFGWARWLFEAAGLTICITGHFKLVRYLRLGIRPSRPQYLLASE